MKVHLFKKTARGMVYLAPSTFANLDWLRLCQIAPPRHPSLFGNGAPRSYQFGFVSPSPNSQILPARGIIISRKSCKVELWLAEFVLEDIQFAEHRLRGSLKL